MGSNQSKTSDSTVPSTSSKHEPKDISDANRLIIDANSLSCPTCFETYVKSPRVLQCGHSFCRICIKQFARPVVSNQSQKQLECPLCLRRMSVVRDDPDQYAVVNFAMDNVLDGLREMALQETCDLSEAVALIPTLRLENKRLRAEVQEKDGIIADLRQKMAAAVARFGTIKGALVKSEDGSTAKRLVSYVIVFFTPAAIVMVPFLINYVMNNDRIMLYFHNLFLYL